MNTECPKCRSQLILMNLTGCQDEWHDSKSLSLRIMPIFGESRKSIIEKQKVLFDENYSKETH